MADRLSEEGLIARHFAPLAGPGALGLRDDTACIAPQPGHDLVVTKDMLVAGVHFFADDPPDSIAHKALRVNLSDLAAKGAEPLGFLLGLGLPNDWQAPWMEAFAEGLGRDARAFRCPLLGGDTVRSPGQLTLSITALGSVPAGRLVPRTGAKVGDRIYVSGTIGDAALGLRLRLCDPRDRVWIDQLAEADHTVLLDRFLHPMPRLGLAGAMRDHAHAGMDVSDGLVGDLTKMMTVSGVSAEVSLAETPLSDAAAAAARAHPECFEIAVTGGDDYEILTTVPPEAGLAFEAAAAVAGIGVTCIGRVTEGLGVPPVFRGIDGSPSTFLRASHDHFR